MHISQYVHEVYRLSADATGFGEATSDSFAAERSSDKTGTPAKDSAVGKEEKSR